VFFHESSFFYHEAVVLFHNNRAVTLQPSLPCSCTYNRSNIRV